MQQKVDLWEEKAKSIYFSLCCRPHEDGAGGSPGGDPAVPRPTESSIRTIEMEDLSSRPRP